MFERLSDRLDKKFEESNTSMLERVEKKFDECSDKFEAKIDIKFLEVQDKLGKMKENITQIESYLNTVIQNQSSLKLKQEEYDIKLNAMEIKYLKLDQTLKDLSKKDESFDSALTFVNIEIEALKKCAEDQKRDQRHDRTRILDVEKKCTNQEIKEEIRKGMTS